MSLNGLDRKDANFVIQSNLDSPDSLGLDEIVWIIENMNINEEKKLIKLRKRHKLTNWFLFLLSLITKL